ncbi:hypothetical protein B0T16DRAFT_451991 [Cercophora newfieldiana]|uniref:VPS37 C-terminal domain-containing protein n=1 Tax=Cercophora newfieldiana TaxID=92897 RepID=A0AA39YR80_9PEZI|nr:hypothetical protein B0T16DRAFT_451991 [Cercophora newfieldiana]
MYSHTPPAPPPKPASRISTPSASGAQSPRRPPPPPSDTRDFDAASQPPPDPGDAWLPLFLQDKSKQDLTTILSSPALLSALTHSPPTIHPSLRASHATLQSALAENISRASELLSLESHLAHQRETTQAQLLATHALERTWRAKQSEMDHALSGFAPARLYQRLNRELVEQEGVCAALEESFLEGEGDGSVAGEREVGEWVRRYREAKKVEYLRRERKERWDEGRVGGGGYPR